MEYDIPLSANEIMTRLGIKSKETLRVSYLNPALENGLIKMTIPNKPNSKNHGVKNTFFWIIIFKIILNVSVLHNKNIDFQKILFYNNNENIKGGM